HEADGLAHPHALDDVEPERGQRPLDRRPLRVGDALTQLHLDEHGELHARAPSQSPNDRPVTRSYAATYRWRVDATTSSGSGGGGGVLSQPVASSQSRTGCLSNDGGAVPGREVAASQK